MTGKDGRGSTHRGRRADLPASSRYEPRPEPSGDSGVGLAVPFVGEDGRRHVFDVGALPLPGWHPSLAAALAQLIGPAGSRRTLPSARGVWGTMARFVRALAQTPNPPAQPRALTISQIETYFQQRRQAVSAQSVGVELLGLRSLFRTPPLPEQLTADVQDHLSRRATIPRTTTKSGYSDGELARILQAARADVAALRDRIDAGERLLNSLDDDPDGDRAAARGIAETGEIPRERGTDVVTENLRRRALAGQLFVTRPDVEPLLVLLTALTQRNVETIKELPAEHRILEGRAVELQVIKRRRGRHRWTETVTWEIGPPHRELHTPGGLYLLAHRLMARGRSVSGASSIWSIWRNVDRGQPTVSEHRDPFAHKLDASLKLPAWSARHQLRTDPQPDGSTDPLVIDYVRVRTSMEVRRTRAVGGHLPSAARSNSVAVLFADYLRGDQTTIEWAHDVTAEALIDAEREALGAHQHALAEAGGKLHIHTTSSPPEAAGAVEATWNACANPQSHPATQKPCRRVSFLDCFHCGNCLISSAHLPAILALQQALDKRRTLEGTDRWWARYGPTWAAIRHHVLPKFTPAEVERARREPTPDVLLDLAEDPWEHP